MSSLAGSTVHTFLRIPYMAYVVRARILSRVLVMSSVRTASGPARLPAHPPADRRRDLGHDKPTCLLLTIRLDAKGRTGSTVRVVRWSFRTPSPRRSTLFCMASFASAVPAKIDTDTQSALVASAPALAIG